MPRNKDTKSQIERAALSLFVSQGITETRTRQIAEAVKISEGTIYRHFESKDTLARDLFKKQHIALAGALAAAAAAHTHIDDQVRAIVTAYCAEADEDWLLFQYHQLSQYALLRYFEDDLPNPVEVVVKVVTDAMERGEISKGDPELYASMALGVVLQAVTFKSFGRLMGPLSEFTENFSEAVIAVLKSNPTHS
jgi:AcrR family transcriptional regulator